MAIQADGAGGRVTRYGGRGAPSVPQYLARPSSPFRRQQTLTAPTPRVASTAGSTSYAAPPASGGGGGYSDSGGGGYAAPAAPPAPPRRSLADVIAEDFSLRQQRDENARLEREYGAETSRLRGETERDQMVRREDLAGDLEDMSLDSSEDLAGRGLLNSGGLFLNQDRINAEGVERENAIADLLTRFLSERSTGLQGLQAQGRNKLNERIGSITSDYGRGIGGY